MLCDRCGKNPPVIQIAGEGSYCADCNNQMMLEKFGKVCLLFMRPLNGFVDFVSIYNSPYQPPGKESLEFSDEP